MASVRAGRKPSNTEVELMREARAKLASLCQGFAPKDMVAREAIGTVIEDLRLHSKLKDQRLGFQTPKMSIAERYSHAKWKVHNSGLIEDQSSEAVEVDFANKYLGGGALGRGCVQEEIYFMVSPELITGMLFLPTMADNETIEIVGVERFSTYTGMCCEGRCETHAFTLSDLLMLKEQGLVQLSQPLFMLLVRVCPQQIQQHMPKKKVRRQRNWHRPPRIQCLRIY